MRRIRWGVCWGVEDTEGFFFVGFCFAVADVALVCHGVEDGVAALCDFVGVGVGV